MFLDYNQKNKNKKKEEEEEETDRERKGRKAVDTNCSSQSQLDKTDFK